MAILLAGCSGYETLSLAEFEQSVRTNAGDGFDVDSVRLNGDVVAGALRYQDLGIFVKEDRVYRAVVIEDDTLLLGQDDTVEICGSDTYAVGYTDGGEVKESRGRICIEYCVEGATVITGFDDSDRGGVGDEGHALRLSEIEQVGRLRSANEYLLYIFVGVGVAAVLTTLYLLSQLRTG
ncbi:hypothetical protein KQI65_05675 [bacterium]|nr:hypothetical protein [bacterium]